MALPRNRLPLGRAAAQARPLGRIRCAHLLREKKVPRTFSSIPQPRCPRWPCLALWTASLSRPRPRACRAQTLRPAVRFHFASPCRGLHRVPTLRAGPSAMQYLGRSSPVPSTLRDSRARSSAASLRPEGPTKWEPGRSPRLRSSKEESHRRTKGLCSARPSPRTR